MASLEDVLLELKQIEKDRQDIDLSMQTLKMQDDGKLYSRTYGELNPSEATIKKMCQMYRLSPSHTQTLIDEGRVDLVASQFNHFLENDNNMMKLRTVNGDRIKGIVPRNYKKFDDYDLFALVYDYLIENNFDYDMNIIHKDDEYTRIRFMLPRTNINMGMADEGGNDRDIVQGGLEISNSEIGMKSMGLNSLVYRQICTNGMMGLIGDNDNKEIFHKRGRDFQPAARRNKLEMGMDKAIDQSNKNIILFKKTKDIKVDEPYTELRRIGSRYNLGQNHIEGMRDSFEHEKQNNYFGVLNSVTRWGREQPDYKTRSRFEFIANETLQRVTS